jgi:hypothetical protein
MTAIKRIAHFFIRLLRSQRTPEKAPEKKDIHEEIRRWQENGWRVTLTRNQHGFSARFDNESKGRTITL